jgi:Transposase Tn5 dimerisation domain
LSFLLGEFSKRSSISGGSSITFSVFSQPAEPADLKRLHRQIPEASCTTILADHEWKALYTAIHRCATLPATPPTVRQAVRWIAQLGGFLARKGDGEPGITTIWRGWSRLGDMADLYLITHPWEDTGNS